MKNYKKPTRAEYEAFLGELAARLGCSADLPEIAAAIGTLLADAERPSEKDAVIKTLTDALTDIGSEIGAIADHKQIRSALRAHCFRWRSGSSPPSALLVGFHEYMPPMWCARAIGVVISSSDRRCMVLTRPFRGVA